MSPGKAKSAADLADETFHAPWPPVAFTVPGQPVPKARPVVTRTGHTFTPTKTVRYEQAVRLIAMAGRPLVTERPLKVEIRLFHGDARRRDADNCAKAILDALNPRRGKRPLPPVVWLDDSQIVDLHVIALRDPGNPRAEVRIEEMP